jgi:hypothetical protein
VRLDGQSFDTFESIARVTGPRAQIHLNPRRKKTLAFSLALVVRLLDGSPLSWPPAQVAPKTGKGVEFVTAAKQRSGSHHGVWPVNGLRGSSRIQDASPRRWSDAM